MEENMIILPPEQQEPISVDILKNSSSMDKTTRILYDNNKDIVTLGSNYYNGSEDVLMLKHNSANSLLSQNSWGGSEKDIGMAMAEDSRGNVYVTGYTRSHMAFEEDLLLIKLNSSGEIEWSKYFDLGNRKGDFGLGITIYNDEAIYVTGYYWDYVFIAGDYMRIYLAKFSMDGNMEWIESGTGISNGGVSEDVVTDELGNIYITGFCAIDDSFIMKYTEDGHNLWKKKWGESGNIEWSKSLINHRNIITSAGYIENKGIFINQFSSSGEFIQSKIEGVVPMNDIINSNMKIASDEKGGIFLPWVDENKSAHISKYSIQNLEIKYDVILPNISVENGFGITYNNDNKQILALGAQGQDQVIFTIPDVEVSLESSYEMEEILYYNLYIHLIGVLFLGFISSRYSIKYSLYCYTCFKKRKKTDEINRIEKILRIINLEKKLLSFEVLLEKFDTENQTSWKKTKTKAKKFNEWLNDNNYEIDVRRREKGLV